MEFAKVGAGDFQNIPYSIEPVALRIGSFSIGWYALMYIAAFLTVYLLLRWRIRKREYPQGLPVIGYGLQMLLEDFILYSFLGVVIGARLGYILFYDLSYYWNNPVAIISPFDATGEFIGIYGMSYHGGLIGVLAAVWIFCRKNKIEFWPWADFAVPAIPAGFFFGRIGNFLNGELYGRITTEPWGMYFPAGGEMLRHPSQLYEAFFEGLLLFLILWSLRNGIGYKNKMFPVPCFALYLFLYGSFRFFLEFFREPDPQLGFVISWAGNGLTMGQILSLGMLLLAFFTALYLRKKKVYNSK